MKRTRFVIGLVLLAFFTVAASLAWHSGPGWLIGVVIAGWLACGCLWMFRYGIVEVFRNAERGSAAFKFLAVVFFIAFWIIPYSLGFDHDTVQSKQT